MRDLPERFPGMYIADMHFDHRRGNGGDRITDGHRSMRVSTRIEDNTVGREPRPLQLVDQFAFDITLKILETDIRELQPQLRKILLKGLAPIHMGLANSQQVQVGSIDN